MLLEPGRRLGPVRVVASLAGFLDRGAFVAVGAGQVPAVPALRVVADQDGLPWRDVIADAAGRLPPGLGAGRRATGGIGVVVGAILGPLVAGRFERRDVGDWRLVDRDLDWVPGGAQRVGQLVDPVGVRAPSPAVSPKPGSAVADVARPADPVLCEDW